MKICLSCEGVTDTQARRCGNCDAPLVPTDAVHYPARRGEVEAGNPLLGTVIDGKYRLQSVLGRGGLGTVFRAQHVGSLVTVALKLLHPRFAQRPEYRRALLPEARRAAAVAHERCARLLDVGEGDAGITYLAMELVEGQTLEEVLQDGSLQPAHALDILLQVADALAGVHDAGLVHCDLSPRNVMVAPRSARLDVKVLDFGIARSVNIAGRRNRDGELWGFANPAFSAPELLAGADVDARADVYSFGTLAWLLLTGTMPVEDGDRDEAVEAVREGRLLPWPETARAPRALRRLILRCLAFDPEQRPASIVEVRQRLFALRHRRGRLLGRVASATAAAATALALLASGVSGAAFLRPQPGSPMQVASGPLAANAAVQDLRSEQLREVEFHYGGIRPERLVAELARAGRSLARLPLAPRVDRGAGTLELSTEQAGWSALLLRLGSESLDGAVDLTFLVPGSVVLGAGRVRLDDAPPSLRAELVSGEGVLCGRSELSVEVADQVGVASVQAELALAGRPPVVLDLPTTSGRVPIGALLAARLDGVAPLGPGLLRLRARDRAGNEQRHQELSFDQVDLAVPEVLQVTGPGGERALPRTGDRLRLRLQLSAGEPGLELRLRRGEHELTLPATMPVSDGVVSRAFDVDVRGFFEGAGELELGCVVRDPAGNERERVFPVRVVDRSPELLVEPFRADGSGPVALFGRELVVGPLGGRFRLQASGDYRIARAQVGVDGRRLAQPGATLRSVGSATELSVAELVPGRYELDVALEQPSDEELEPVQRSLALRVLPASLVVQVPASSARFVPELVDAGLLSLRGQRRSQRVGEGNGWRYPAELRSYVEGACFSSGRPYAAVRPEPGPLLAEVALQPGQNALSIQLVDALGRPVEVVDEAGQSLAGDSGRVVLATCWWSDEAPRLVGERLLVEHERALRARVDVQLPFDVQDRERLRLGLGNGEWPAAKVEGTGGAAALTFEVPFAAWSAAAQLAGRSREEFADGLEARIEAYLLTPDGRSALTLPLRTTRSTLSPVRLGELLELPDGLQQLQLLPVLAPEGPFAEPVPEEAPPRATFRPQQATAVRNMQDILLQDREFTVGEARAVVAGLEHVVDEATRAALVHVYDPLGQGRLEAGRLLPDGAADADPAQTLVGVDFFQAWSLVRLLGVVVGGDPDLFRLPLGCELELAAYSGAAAPACSGVVAHRGSVSAGAFRSAVAGGYRAELSQASGDAVPTAYDRPFLGLDFGVREWVLDVPHVPTAALLLREWIGDHAVHLSKVLGGGAGSAEGQAGRIEGLDRIGVVRGLAFGEAAGLVGLQGERLELVGDALVPECVPGVLRTEQLRRDGRALLGAGRDERLSRVGFRVAADAERLARRWGFR